MQISKIQIDSYNNNLNRRKSANNKPNIQDFEHNTQNYVQIPLSTHQTKMISFGSGISADDFVISARNNDLCTIREYIKSGGDVNALNTYGRTALYMAAYNYHLAVIKELAKCPDLDPNRRTLNNNDEKESFTPLGVAAYFNNSSTMQELLKLPNIDVNIVSDKDGRSPLLIAYKDNNYDVIEILLNDPRVDVNFIPENNIIRPLIYSIISNADNDALDILLNRDDVDLNIPWGKYEDVISYCKDVRVSYLNEIGGRRYAINTEKMLQMLEEYAKEHPNSSAPRKININQITNDALTAENNIYTSEEITTRFINLVSNKANRQQALEMLTYTPLVDFDANNKKALETVIKTGDIEFARAVFDYIFHKQSQQRVEYDRRRRELFSNMSNKSYEELIKMSVIVNTEDGLRELTNRLEFDPNYKIEGKTLFARACEYDKTYELAKDILARRDNVDISVIKKPDEQLKAIIEDYKNGGRNSVKMENLRIDLMSRSRAQEALERAREYVRSEECSAQNTKPNTTNILHALSTSTVDGSTEVMNIAINKGIDIDSRNLYQQTPLMLALRSVKVTNPDSPERKYTLAAVKYLLDKGADISAKDKGGKTVLHYACMSGSPTALRMVLNKEPNILTKDYNGNLPKAFLNNDEIREVYNDYVKNLLTE